MVTLKDISKVAGVNVSTVSKALRKSDDINKETIAKIEDIAKEMGYRQKGKEKVAEKHIGVICPEIKSNYYAHLISGIEREAKDKGYSILIGFTNFNEEVERHYLNHFIKSKTSGIILITENQVLDKVLSSYKKDISLPVVVISSNAETAEYDCISIDDSRGVQLAIEHLISSGHKKIGYIGDYLSSVRLNAFKKAMSENGLVINAKWIKENSDRFEECGYNQMQEIINEGSLPTAVFGAYDDIAIGVMKCLVDNNIKIPEDISVVGIDDIRVSGFVAPSLTTISVPVHEMAEITLDILNKKIENEDYKVVQSIKLAPNLVIRNSTKEEKKPL